MIHTPLRRREIVVTHTIHQTKIPALLDIRVTNTSSVKILCPQNNSTSLYFRRNITYLRVGQLNIVYSWVMKHRCLLSDNSSFKTNLIITSIMLKSKILRNCVKCTFDNESRILLLKLQKIINS